MDVDVVNEPNTKKVKTTEGLCNGNTVNGNSETNDTTIKEKENVSNGETSPDVATNGKTNGVDKDHEMDVDAESEKQMDTEESVNDKSKPETSDNEEKKEVSLKDGDNESSTKDSSKTSIDSNESANKPSAPNCETDTSKPSSPVNDQSLLKPVKNKYTYLEKGIADSEELRPVAELLFSLGLSLAKEQVYEDLSRVHKKQKEKETLTKHGEKYGDLFDKNLEKLIQVNKPLSLDMINCKECTFKTESDNVLQWHLEFAHGQDSNTYQCSFCEFIGKQPGEFFFHMEAEHNRKGRIYMKHAFFSCALCPFENNSRKALVKHQQKCERTFKMKRNLEPAPTDCDIPLKLVKPRVPIAKPAPKPPINNTVRNMMQNRQQQNYLDMQNKLRQQQQQRLNASMAAQQQQQQIQLLQPRQQTSNQMMHQLPLVPPGSNSNQRMNVPLYQGVQQMAAAAVAAAQSRAQMHRPAPPPLQKAPKPNTTSNSSSSAGASNTPSMPTGAAARYDICEICGGFVKDRESLRIHFYWAHKVDIQKNVFEKKQPHLICEFCPQRFWTYQGLARHRQITHNKQQASASNSTSSTSTVSTPKSKPQHNCILCGAVNVAHLLNHLSNAHNITLQTMFKQKRCLCCGSSFAEEKLLERHMLNSHSDLFRIKPHSKKTPSKSPQVGAGGKDTEKPKTVSCPMCKARFPNSEAFDDHFARHHSYKCHRCKQVYSAQDMVSKHWHEVHAKESEACQLCDDMVRIGRPYIRHLRSSHLGNFSIVLKRLNRDVTKFLLTNKRHDNYRKPAPRFVKLRAEQAPGPKSMKIKAVFETVQTPEKSEVEPINICPSSDENVASSNKDTGTNQEPMEVDET